MPYDFYNMQSYSIDYADLLNNLLSLSPILKSPLTQKQYIEKWISTLSYYDESIIKTMNNPQEVQNYIIGKQSEPEVFQIPIYVGKNEILLHYRITPLLQLLDYHKVNNTMEIEIEEFLSDDLIKWTQESQLGKAPIDKPIIVAPFPIGHYKVVVVDGNHRLSQSIKSGRKSISAISLAAKTFIDSNLFSCSFDKLVYTMFIEFQCAKACYDKDMSDDSILQLSYLFTNDTKFHHVE